MTAGEVVLIWFGASIVAAAVIGWAVRRFEDAQRQQREDYNRDGEGGE